MTNPSGRRRFTEGQENLRRLMDAHPFRPIEPEYAGAGHHLDETPITAQDWERAAQFLFALLDNIDTAFDLAKEDSGRLRWLITREHRRRFEIAGTNGHEVYFSALAIRDSQELPI